MCSLDAKSVCLLLRPRLLREALGRLLQDAGLKLLDSGPEAMRRADFIIVGTGDCIGNAEMLSDIRKETTGRVVILADDNARYLSLPQIMAVDGIVAFRASSLALLEALALIDAGERIIPVDLIDQIAPPPEPEAAINGNAPFGVTHLLSRREIDILCYLVNGASNRLIAQELGITESTVKVQLKALTRKIGADNRTQAALWARSHGFDENPVARAALRVRQAEGYVARQQELIDTLQRNGHIRAAELAKDVLTTLRTSLDLARDQLRLARGPDPP
jgi:two-component system nitrate/nitrite response regulator NarL